MVAIRLGVILALVGILWQAFQMVFGTLEQRKFLVGTITKWFLFLACLTFYPGISRGLYKFAIQMGSYVSGSSIKEITDEFGAYLEALEKALKTSKWIYDASGVLVSAKDISCSEMNPGRFLRGKCPDLIPVI